MSSEELRVPVLGICSMVKESGFECCSEMVASIWASSQGVAGTMDGLVTKVF